MSGSWNTEGDSVTLSFAGLDTQVQPDDPFTLSADGRRLAGAGSKSGTMIKQ